MTPTESASLVRRAANAFVLFALVLAFKLAVGAAMLASTTHAEELLTMNLAVMLILDVIAGLLWLEIGRRSLIACWIACAFILLVSVANVGDVASYASRADRLPLESPAAFNGISGALMLAVGLVALVILLRVDTREAFSAPPPNRDQP